MTLAFSPGPSGTGALTVAVIPWRCACVPFLGAAASPPARVFRSAHRASIRGEVPVGRMMSGIRTLREEGRKKAWPR